MTWSYLPSLATDKDRVRLKIGDTDTTSQLFSDEEIEALLTDNGDDVFETAAQLCDALATKYARRGNLRIDDFSIDFKSRAEHFAALADQIRQQAANSPGQFGAPIVGGISISEMESVRDDTDRVPSRFEVGKFSHPGTETVEINEETD